LQLYHPSALKLFDQILYSAKGKQIVVFLDYDGTLSPIVADPDKAFMTRNVFFFLSKVFCFCFHHWYIRSTRPPNLVWEQFWHQVVSVPLSIAVTWIELWSSLLSSVRQLALDQLTIVFSFQSFVSSSNFIHRIDKIIEFMFVIFYLFGYVFYFLFYETRWEERLRT
jgi:hypothetical protein